MTNEEQLDKDGVTTVSPAASFISAASTVMEALSAKTVIKPVRLSSLKVDPDVQRPLHMPRVKRIAERYDAVAFGLPAVSCRDDGTNVLLDGMHRVAALRLVPAAKRGGDDPEVLCETWSGMTKEQEARVFVLRNATEKVPAISLFKVRVNGNDPSALAVRDVLSTYGWAIRMDRKNGAVNAVDAVERCFNTNPWATTQAVEAVSRAWPALPAVAMDSRLFRAMWMIFKKHEGRVNMERLVSRIGGKNTPDSLITAGDYHAKMTRGVTVSRGIAITVLKDYNKTPGMNLNPEV